MFYSHFCAHGRLNGPSDLQRQWDEVKDETTFRHAHAEIRSRVVVICGPTRYRQTMEAPQYPFGKTNNKMRCYWPSSIRLSDLMALVFTGQGLLKLYGRHEDKIEHHNGRWGHKGYTERVKRQIWNISVAAISQLWNDNRYPSTIVKVFYYHWFLYRIYSSIKLLRYIFVIIRSQSKISNWLVGWYVSTGHTWQTSHKHKYVLNPQPTVQKYKELYKRSNLLHNYKKTQV